MVPSYGRCRKQRRGFYRLPLQVIRLTRGDFTDFQYIHSMEGLRIRRGGRRRAITGLIAHGRRSGLVSRKVAAAIIGFADLAEAVRRRAKGASWLAKLITALCRPPRAEAFRWSRGFS